MREFLSPDIAIDAANTFRIILSAIITIGGGYLIRLLHKSISSSTNTEEKSMPFKDSRAASGPQAKVLSNPRSDAPRRHVR